MRKVLGMNLKDFIRRRYLMLAAIMLVSLVVGLLYYRTLGIKDTTMIFAATFLLLLEVYLIFVDRKISILLFILSFPILVISRKICYTGYSLFKFNYESIYIVLLFIAGFKNIAAYIKKNTAVRHSSETNFIVLCIIFIVRGSQPIG
jgi:predicted neutral ceramidase superfamily lipid hydrolase